MAELIGFLIVVAFLVALYMLPTIVAFNRGLTNRWSVCIINVAFGWTFLGWVISLAMAASGAKTRLA